MTCGSYADDEVAEFRYMMHFAQQKAKEKICAAAQDYQRIFGDYFGGLFDTFFCDDAEIILVAMGFVIGTLRDAVSRLRHGGEKVSLLKVRSYRPFPGEEILEAVKSAKIVAVIDKSLSVGQGGAVGIGH